MREHVHWGVFDVIFAGVSAIVVMNVLHYVAIGLHSNFPTVTSIIGGALNFGVVNTKNEVSS